MATIKSEINYKSVALAVLVAAKICQNNGYTLPQARNLMTYAFHILESEPVGPHWSIDHSQIGNAYDYGGYPVAPEDEYRYED